MAKYRFSFSIERMSIVMSSRKILEEELTTLLEEQSEARRDEVFGGFTQSERAAYAARNKRIFDLESKVLEARQIDSDSASRRREWNQQSEADTPQSGAQQPYRSRERDSSKAFT